VVSLAGQIPTHLGRRLESTEAASDFVVLLVRLLWSALEALEATPREVLTELRAIQSPPFLPVSIGGVEQHYFNFN